MSLTSFVTALVLAIIWLALRVKLKLNFLQAAQCLLNRFVWLHMLTSWNCCQDHRKSDPCPWARSIHPISRFASLALHREKLFIIFLANFNLLISTNVLLFFPTQNTCHHRRSHTIRAETKEPARQEHNWCWSKQNRKNYSHHIINKRFRTWSTARGQT